MKYLILSIAAACLLAFAGNQFPNAASSRFSSPQSEPINQSFNVDGVERAAVIYPNSKPAPKSGTRPTKARKIPQSIDFPALQ